MNHVNRREFLGATASMIAASGLAMGEEPQSPIKVGVIGCGWFGNEHLKGAFEAGGVDVIALCDLDSAHLDKTADFVETQQGKRPQLIKDYRDLIKLPDLQAVFIATPPHWHALPFIAACEAGLDIYCEKPLAYDIREGQAMVDAAAKAGNIVQIGFQRRQGAAVRAVRDYLKTGKSGKVVQVDAQIHFQTGRKDRTPSEPPKTLDWDFWCGPAPKLPHSEAVGHFFWRMEKEYGNGHLVDWGIHLIDATRYILGESMPKRIVAAGGLYELGDHITTPDVLTVHFEFDSCPVVWRHRIWGAQEYRPEVSNGVFFYCEKETIFVNDTRWMIIPKSKDAKSIINEMKPEKGLVPLNVGEFLQAMRSRKQPSVTPADAFQSTAAVELAMISYEVGAPVVWDQANMKITNNAEAHKRLKREYRAPWQHPYKG